MGRPVKNIDQAQVEKLAGIGCTLEEMAVVLDCAENTLRRRFGRAIKAGRLNANASLRRTQWQTATGTATTKTVKVAPDGATVTTTTEGRAPSAAMQIWLGKQLLGQKEKVEASGPNGGPIETHELGTVSDDRLDAEIKKLNAALQNIAATMGDQAEAGRAAEGEGPAAG